MYILIFYAVPYVAKRNAANNLSITKYPVECTSITPDNGSKHISKTLLHDICRVSIVYVHVYVCI